MTTLSDIAQSLVPLCEKVELAIVGQTDRRAARQWAEASARRHAHTVQAIQAFAKRTGKRSLRILNASGLACGHQDFATASALSRTYDVAWTVYESPTSPYLKNPTLRALLRSFGMKLVLSDFTATKQLYGSGTYDVILFTEIAEHLEHSTFLRALDAMRARLAPDGILILTTPNAVTLGNRLSVLRGNGDIAYWGDGRANLKARLWGHIVYYDARRLRRLLADAGLAVRTSYTFWYNRSDRSVLGTLIHALAALMPNSKQTLFIEAVRSEPAPIRNEI